ncbi:ubiquinol-cytochrome c reductase iron-sulfur subunit [Pseudomonas sp. EpS/L25]|uniref:ubiquinol-cytochrome c reductase iron-sulfur subunit n=1 Tax=Pseudomonas sp. EpS/L25 TaxID=1749078 RepID=UPI000743F5FE|nr:ubiquinol-cytochrome c reductase iron-sulfur subunit [Pseudomonas sp. EpS/L25]KUM34086.1 ubiquinol-cytochrome c reductase iron-sulfur subunit [Pseudomonas sp. EpS/L25]
MTDDSPDAQRRRLLIATTSAVGGLGLVAGSVPFVCALRPSRSAEVVAAPVEVDIGTLREGEQLTVQWRGQPVCVLRRSAADQARLLADQAALADPDSRASSQPPYVDPRLRSRRPDIFVATAICTHLGCIPSLAPSAANQAGGYLCPCHGSHFDLAGRVYRDQPAPLNLAVPPYHFRGDNLLVIGSDDEGVA